VLDRALLGAALAVPLVACAPRSIADAEKKGDVAWLDKKGTPEAIAALGRVADKDPRAAQALDRRGDYDRDVYAAAWDAVLRSAAWGTELYKASLANPARTELAAGTMPKKDPHLGAFVSELESGLVRLGASQNNLNVASTLASVGAPAQATIARLLANAATRTAMCRGLASSDAAPESRATMMQAPATSRDSAPCVDSITKMAADDNTVLGWLGEAAEPGLLSVAGKSELLPCVRLHDAWVRALTARPQERALVVALKNAIDRCPSELDGVLADAITRTPASQPVIVDAIDPFQGYGITLKATCAALPQVLRGGAPAITRERVSHTLEHTCKRR
jgi:hypothetical protein